MSKPSLKARRKSLQLGFVLAVVGSGLVLAGGRQVAHATSLTVNTAEDVAPNGNGKFPTDGKCSLRAAIRAAESNSNAHDADCPTGLANAQDVIVLDRALAGQTLRLTYAVNGGVQPFDPIYAGGPLSIVGETDDPTDFVISGEGVVRPFSVGFANAAAGSLTLANLTVANGNGTGNGASTGAADGFGGAIHLGDNGRTGSTLILDNVVLRDNSASSGGGAISATRDGTITNNGGAYIHNSSPGWLEDAGTPDDPDIRVRVGKGGAIASLEGELTLNGYAVLFQGNTASSPDPRKPGLGGAVYANQAQMVHLERSLLVDNTASAGGVLYVDSGTSGKVFELHDSTAIGNSSVFLAQANTQSFEYLRDTFVDSGEIFRTGVGFMANSIVTGANSCALTADAANFTGSRNLIDSFGCKPAGFNDIGDITGLGPLAQNGGPAVQQTFGLLPGSNAIDNGDPAYCGTVDARSIKRGVDGDGTLNSPQARDCDIGAYEFVKAVVNFGQGTPVVNEGDGSTSIPVRLRLLDPDLQSLTSEMTVGVEPGPGSTARIGPGDLDDLYVPGNAVTFPVGSTDGATANLVMHLHQDSVAEHNGETAVLQLTADGIPGVAIAEPNTASIVIQDDDQAGVIVTETDGSTQVSEADTAARDSFGVRLQSQPDFEPGTTTPADVTMTVTPDRDCILRRGTTVVTASDPIVIDIRNADWRTVTTFDVFGVDDPYDEDLRDEAAPHPCELRFTFTSLDPVYASTQDAFEVDVTDDDTAAVLLDEVAQPLLIEGGTDSARWTVRLNSVPDPGKPLPATPRGPTRVRFTPTGQCDVGAGPGVARDVSFTSSNWNAPQEVVISPAQDLSVERLHRCAVQTTVLGDDPVYVDLSNRPAFSGTPASIDVDIQDYDPPNGITDDPPFVEITAPSIDVDEGTDTGDTVSVVLRRAPVGAPVLVKLDAVVDPKIGGPQLALGTGGGPFGPDATLTFTAANWNIPQTVEVRAADDDFDEPTTHRGAFRASIESTAPGFSDPQLARLVVNGVKVAGTATFPADVTDDDASKVLVTETGGTTNVDEAGGADTVAVGLATHPYADVTVTLTAGAECLVDGVRSRSTVIPDDAWATPVTFTVSAVDDDDIEHDRQDCPIRMSVAADDPLYDVLPDHTVTARVTDDDIAEVIVDTAGGIKVGEAGRTDTFTAVLGSRPVGNVTVEFSGAALFVSETRTFTRSNWNVPQTYTVTAIDDDIDESTPHAGSLGMNVTTTDPDYRTGTTLTVDSSTAPDVDVAVVDDDTAGLSMSTPTISLVEGGAGDTFTVALDSEPGADVTLSLTGDPQCQTAPANHNFKRTNWDRPVTITVTTPTDDDIAQEDRQCSVAVAATSSDPSYNRAGATVTGTIADDDVAGVATSAAAGQISEWDPTSATTYTLTLTSRPAADVSIGLTADAQVTVSPPTVTFGPANWNQPQTVTVTAVHDQLTEATPHTGRVTHTVTSADPMYNGIPVAAGVVAVRDDDTITRISVQGRAFDTVNTTAAATITGGEPSPTGVVRFELDGAAVRTVTVTAGSARIRLGQLPRGTHTLSARYGGDRRHSASLATVVFDVGAAPLCGGRPATLVGTPGDDVLTGTAGSDVIVARGGNDTINGRAGNDIICAGAGHDTAVGRAGDDTLQGWYGDDLLVGHAGRDTLRGGDGKDDLNGGRGNDLLRGAAGNDRLHGGRGNDHGWGGTGTDAATACETTRNIP